MSKEKVFQFSIDNLIQNVENSASSFFEGFTDALVGEANSLRDGTELDPVDLPRDLYAHRNAQTEWWYYTGHAKTDSGREFGFELVFFKRRTDLDKFGPVPLRLLGNPIYFAHFAVTDHEKKRFVYSHRKSANGIFDFPASASERHFHLRLGDWSIRESHGNHILRASVGDRLVFDASLNPTKNLILNGEHKNGVSIKDEGEASRYFSYTRMDMEGDILLDGRNEHFRGSAWMDREFGTWTATENQKGWDWFSIQLNDNTELMCYQLRNSLNEISPYSRGVYIDKDGGYTPLSNEEFTIVTTGYWKSPRTKAAYPSGWKISVPKFDIELSVKPIIEDQELDTRGTTMVIYWEGACQVLGKTKNDAKISGNAYVELVGYDRSHDSPNLAYFLMGSSFEFPGKTLFGWLSKST